MDLWMENWLHPNREARQRLVRVREAQAADWYATLTAVGRHAAAALAAPRALGRAVSAWRVRRQTARELAALPDRLLADVGIERGDIAVVAAAMTLAAQGEAPVRPADAVVAAGRDRARAPQRPWHGHRPDSDRLPSRRVARRAARRPGSGGRLAGLPPVVRPGTVGCG